jgi:dihydroorotate dehydrogenase
VINRMGFNNAGAAALAARLETLGLGGAGLGGAGLGGAGSGGVGSGGVGSGGAGSGGLGSGRVGLRGVASREVSPLGVPLGISLGKSKITPLESAVDDYLTSYRLVRPYADYIAVNVSSPNTPGLRTLQDKSHLAALLGALAGQTPVLVKIAPDLTEPAIAEVLEVCLAQGAAGIIATNTTLGRDGLAAADQPRAAEAGGLSGRPLTERARKVVHFVHAETGGRLPIIGVGGLMDPDDAARLFDAGASLVQLYTGFIYRGPALVRAIARAYDAARAGARR